MKHAFLYFLLFAVTLTIQAFAIPCHDLVWLTWGIEEHLKRGGQYYTDIFEPNPPWIFMLYTPAVMLANLLGADPVVTIRIMSIGLVAAILPLCHYILARSDQWPKEVRQSMVLGIAGILLTGAHYFIVLGQREYLFVVFILPYVLFCLPSVNRKKISVPLQAGIGVLAAAGFIIKPYFLVVWVFVAIASAIAQRSLGSLFILSNWLIGAAALVYGAAIWLFFPDYVALAKIVAATYGAYGFLGQSVASKAAWFLWAGILCVVIGWVGGLWTMKPAPYRRDVYVLAAVAFGAYLQALLQFKTWEYILYPCLVFGAMAWMVLVAQRRTSHMLSIILAVWFFFPSTPLTYTDQQEYEESYAELMALLKPYAAEPEIYTLSLYFSPPPQFYRHEGPLRWTGKFNYLAFLLDGIMEKSPRTHRATNTVRPGMEGLNEWVLRNVEDDLQKKDPKLLLIVSHWSDEPVGEDYFDFHRWVRQDQALFRRIAQYKLVEEKDFCVSKYRIHHCMYQVYIKKDL